MADRYYRDRRPEGVRSDRARTAHPRSGARPVFPQGSKIRAKNFLRIGGIKIRLGPLDYQFLLITVVLIAFGLIMLYSASSSRAYSLYDGDSLFFVKSQLGGLALGVVAMLFCMTVDYHVISRLWPLYYGIGLVMLILVLIPGIGTEAGGATRWLWFFQPSELVKVAVVIALAAFIEKRHDKMSSFVYGFLPCLALYGAVAVLLIFEPHFSATMLIGLTVLLMMFIGGAKIAHFLAIGAPAVAGAVVLVLTSPYRMARITSFFDPFADMQGKGYQIVQSLYAIGSGGIFGVGFGQSRQKYMSLPEPHNDFIFSVIAEELGWMGAIIVIVLFILLIWRGFRIAQKAPDLLGTLLVTGCIGLIGIQAVVNIGVVTHTLPATGMPLPFFSYGGTALAITMAEIGLILNVSSQERVL